MGSCFADGNLAPEVGTFARTEATGTLAVEEPRQRRDRLVEAEDGRRDQAREATMAIEAEHHIQTQSTEEQLEPERH